MSWRLAFGGLAMFVTFVAGVLLLSVFTGSDRSLAAHRCAGLNPGEMSMITGTIAAIHGDPPPPRTPITLWNLRIDGTNELVALDLGSARAALPADSATPVATTGSWKQPPGSGAASMFVTADEFDPALLRSLHRGCTKRLSPAISPGAFHSRPFVSTKEDVA